MNILNIIVTNNSLKMNVRLSQVINRDIRSPLYKFNFIECQLKELTYDNVYWSLHILLKKCIDDHILCTFRVISEKLEIKKTFFSDDSDWRVLVSNASRTSNSNFEIEVIVDIKTTPLSRHLLNDSLMNLEIKGIDGSILVDRAVLAAASEVFMKMITNDFKEKKEARVELPYSVYVLQDLKDYLYLNTFSNNNLENLFMFAHCYMMYELKHKCVGMLFLKSLKYMQENKDSGEYLLTNKLPNYSL